MAPDPAEEERSFRQAVSDLQEATRLDPSLAEAWSLLSLLYSEQADNTEAKLAARRALEADEFLQNADEILFHAGLHPKTTCSQLKEEDIQRLYNSIKVVMAWGIEEVRKAGQPIEVKVREHLKVRNRKGEPCPVCGSLIRRASVLGYDTFFCPRCQPPTTKQFIAWDK